MKKTKRLYVCDRKRRYGSEEGAQRAIRKIHNRRAIKGARVYHCQYCHGWHWGHQSKRQKEFNVLSVDAAEVWRTEERPDSLPVST